MNQKFSKFRESDKSLKHELDSISRSSLLTCDSLGTMVTSWSLIQKDSKHLFYIIL